MLENLDLISNSNKFDYLICDEAQDYLEKDHQVLDALLKKGLKDGKWMILGDFINQLLYGQNKDDYLNKCKNLLIDKYGLGNKFTMVQLTKNYRNNQEIQEEINRLLGLEKDNLDYKSIDAKRKDVQYIEYRQDARPNSPFNQLTNVTKIIQNLLESGYTESQITILTYKKWEPKKEKNNIIDALSETYTIVPKDTGKSKYITHATFRTFKGLYNDVIIILNVDDPIREGKKLTEIYERYLCAIARAKEKVFVFETKDAKNIREIGFYKGEEYRR